MLFKAHTKPITVSVRNDANYHEVQDPSEAHSGCGNPKCSKAHKVGRRDGHGWREQASESYTGENALEKQSCGVSIAEE
jgi:hypothetical protein